MSVEAKRFLLLYGSQTGQAQAIAEQICDDSIAKGLNPDLHCLDQSEKKFHLEKERVFVVVVSTTGDGDPPDNVSRFWRRLKKKTLPSDHLTRCNYALLGLGDTNYSNFCNMGKMLNKRLLELGAKQFYPPGFADDGVGLDIVVEPWIAGLWEELFQILKTDSSEVDNFEGKGEVDRGADQTGSTAIESVPAERDRKTCVVTEREDTDQATEKVFLVRANGLIMEERESGSSEAVTSLNNERQGQDRVEQLSSTVKEKLTVSTSSKPSHVAVEKSEIVPVALGRTIDESRLLSLRTCSDSCAGVNLSLPSLPPAYLTVELKEVETVPDFPFLDVSYGINLPPPLMADIIGSRVLTKDTAKKKTLELELSVPDLNYEPGDAFGFVCPNNEGEVEWLLQRLNLVEDADKMMDLSIIKGTTKRSASLPKHIPKLCSVRQFFTRCADIRCVLKKAHLHFLSTHCSCQEEGRRLQELSSKQGSGEYTSLFTEGRTDFLDLLYSFPSCSPPLSQLLELLPRLQPRYYSAASALSCCLGRLKIAFNVERLPVRFWSHEVLSEVRSGLASGWLEKTAAKVTLTGKKEKVPVFPRLLNTFHLPEDHSHPIIMIGPGTGVAPFIGFLQHRETQMQRASSHQLGKSWLFFGCRDPNTDHLYKEEMDHFVGTGCLSHLHVAYSQPLTSAISAQGPSGSISSSWESSVDRSKYVQDQMKLNCRELGAWIVEEKALVYVCGDARNMARDVDNALLDIISRHLRSLESLSLEYQRGTPEQVIQTMKEEKRYLVDAWS